MLKENIYLKIITIIVTALSITALIISYQSNYILTYNDAASHLNIARRVIDNLTPGIAQIGTVWLPLPHLLMLPFAWNDYLWHTGFAGSIVSMAAFVISVVFLYKTVYLVTKSAGGAVVGALIMALNPNFLYIQTTPMTEPLLIATFVIAVYFLAKYLMHWQIQSLLLCSVFVASSTLIRYDGWFLFASLCVLLPVWILAWRGWKEAESSILLFMFMGSFGIAIWLLWNLAIFGDPLYFITGPYSAYAQQRVLKQVGQLPTDGNIYLSSYYYMWSVISNNGMILFITAVIGVCIIPFFLKQKKFLLIFMAASAPILFNTIALYIGQSAMNVPQAPTNPGMFNIRYGMMALPFIALLLGVLASNKFLRVGIIGVLIVQSFFFLKAGHPVSLADGLHGLHETYYTVEASTWFRENYDGGLILTSLASHDAFVARTGLPMKNYVHEGTRGYWERSLVTPSKEVRYITVLSFPPDSVYRSISKTADFKKNFVLVHRYENFQIYKKKTQ